MELEVLVVRGCANEAAATALAGTVLVEMGCPGSPLTVRVISSQAEADEVEFLGSPTFLIDGADPFAQPGRAAALACRLYPTPARLPGLPDARRLALRAADFTEGSQR